MSSSISFPVGELFLRFSTCAITSARFPHAENYGSSRRTTADSSIVSSWPVSSLEQRSGSPRNSFAKQRSVLCENSTIMASRSQCPGTDDSVAQRMREYRKRNRASQDDAACRNNGCSKKVLVTSEGEYFCQRCNNTSASLQLTYVLLAPPRRRRHRRGLGHGL